VKSSRFDNYQYARYHDHVFSAEEQGDIALHTRNYIVF